MAIEHGQPLPSERAQAILEQRQVLLRTTAFHRPYLIGAFSMLCQVAKSYTPDGAIGNLSVAEINACFHDDTDFAPIIAEFTAAGVLAPNADGVLAFADWDLLTEESGWHKHVHWGLLFRGEEFRQEEYCK